MNLSNKKKILMISSSKEGGGPKHILILSEQISEYYDLYHASPLFQGSEFYKKDKFLQISERKVCIADIIKLIKFIRRNSINIIHAHGKGAGLLARLVKLLVDIPLVFTFHGIHIQCHTYLYRKVYWLYEALFGRIDNHKIFVSKSELSQAKKYKIYIGNNFSIVNNAVQNRKSKELITRNSSIKNPFLNYKHKKIIVSICRLVKQKNIFEIFKIAKKLKNYTFIIIGNGEIFDKANKYIVNKQIENVYLLGEKKDIYPFIYFADLFLSTSLYEGLPISILEAMSIGLPIVASNVEGNKDTVIHNKNGFLYELGNIEMATQYINLILNSESLNSKFSRNSIILQKRVFSLSKMKKSYLKIYERF